MGRDFGFGVLAVESPHQLVEGFPLVSGVVGFGLPILPESTDQTDSHRRLIESRAVVAWGVFRAALDGHAVTLNQPVVTDVEEKVLLTEGTVAIRLAPLVLLVWSGLSAVDDDPFSSWTVLEANHVAPIVQPT